MAVVLVSLAGRSPCQCLLAPSKAVQVQVTAFAVATAASAALSCISGGWWHGGWAGCQWL